MFHQQEISEPRCLEAVLSTSHSMQSTRPRWWKPLERFLKILKNYGSHLLVHPGSKIGTLWITKLSIPPGPKIAHPSYAQTCSDCTVASGVFLVCNSNWILWFCHFKLILIGWFKFQSNFSLTIQVESFGFFKLTETFRFQSWLCFHLQPALLAFVSSTGSSYNLFTLLFVPQLFF